MVIASLVFVSFAIFLHVLYPILYRLDKYKFRIIHGQMGTFNSRQGPIHRYGHSIQI